MMLNYKVFFIADGNATLTDAEHNATLSAMAHTFCDVVDADTVVAMIQHVGATARTEKAMAIAVAVFRRELISTFANPVNCEWTDSMFTRRGFIAPAGAAAFPGLPATAAGPQILCIDMTAADLPTTHGIPNNGGEGFRSLDASNSLTARSSMPTR